MLPSRVDKQALWKEHSKNFTCTHLETELRERTVRGGSIQYVHQCLKCGEATTSPIRKNVAIDANYGKLPAPFDESIKEKWNKQSHDSAQQIQNIDDSAFWNAYGKYLDSNEWAAKRNKVFKRANNICEGCLENPATQVHHLSYEHVGAEFLFELAAICDECHERIHPRQDNNSA